MSTTRTVAFWFSALAVAVILLTGCSGPLQRGEVCMRIGDYENAICFFDLAVKRNPGSVQARSGLARAWLQHCVARDADSTASAAEWRQAYIRFDYAIRLHADTALRTEAAYCSYRLAKTLSSTGDTASALRAAAAAVALRPDVKYVNLTAILNYRLGNQVRAQELFVMAATADSTDATAFYNLGVIAWNAGRYVDAYRWFLKALRIAPRNTGIQRWYAMAEVKCSTLLRGGTPP